MKLSLRIFCLGWWLTRQRWMAEGQSNLKPSISVNPNGMVVVGEKVNIHCKSKYTNAEFILHQRDPLQLHAWQTKNARTSEFIFAIPRAERRNAGAYCCQSCIKSGNSQACSLFSNIVYINITDPLLSKPSIKAIPGEELAPGLNATIECQGPETSWNFMLRKSEDLIASQMTEPKRNTTEFPFFMVNLENTGNYTCQYNLRHNPFVWSEPSDPIQIVVRDADPQGLDATIEWASIAASLLLLVLLLLLIVFILYRKRRKGSTANERTQPPPMKETNMTIEPGEDPDGISYAVLNHHSLTTKQAAVPDGVPEPCVYAAVAENRTRNG